MMMRAEDIVATARPDVDADAGVRTPSASTGIDWRARFEQERARADAAEARCEDLRRAEIDARSKAGSYRSLHEQGRAKLEAARVELEAVRRTSRSALRLEAEVGRLQRLVEAAGMDSRKRTTNAGLRMEVGRLSAALERQTDKNRKLKGRVRKLEKRARKRKARIGELEAEVEKLRSTKAVLSRDRYGTRSEKQVKEPSGRKRGQRTGAPGHGRTPREHLEKREERHEPPEDTLACSDCGAPLVGNGEHVSELIEVHVEAHVRRIRRPRYRKSCGCPSTPAEVAAAPPARLFENTDYGISVWAFYLYERFVSMRPVRRIAAWLADHGLPIAPGTLLGGTQGLLALFAPLAAAIFAHLNQAAVRHADETSWRVQELGRTGKSRRAWLWSSLSTDAVHFHIDPARSAEAARKLFADVAGPVFLVCDRYSAYKKLARNLAGTLVLCFCWAHQRRDFIKCAAGHEHLEPWRDDWIREIGAIYHLNRARLERFDPGADVQSPAFRAAQVRLEAAVDALFAKAERELAALADDARQCKPLRSLINHRAGLTVFLDHPQIPLDNNSSEAIQRPAAIGRKLSFGSDSLEGARLTVVMYTVFCTLAMNRIDVWRWLTDWLGACAENGHSPPEDLRPWLPWTMSEERRRALTRPG